MIDKSNVFNSRECELSAVLFIVGNFSEFIPFCAMSVFVLAADLLADEVAGC